MTETLETTPEARPLRICFIIEKLAERSGGAERVLVEAANALAERGHAVDILSHEFRGRPPFYPLRPGILHVNIRPQRKDRSFVRRWADRRREWLHAAVQDLPPPLDRLLWLSRNGGFWRRVERYLKANRPDVAIAFMPPAMTALAMARPGYRLRRIAATHNAPEQDFNNPARWDPSALDRRRRRALMDRFDLVTVLLPEYRDWYPETLRPRIGIMPNPVSPVNPAALAAARRRKIVMAVGRLSEVKRPRLLIDAWALLSPEFPDWTLQIYGVGPLQADLAAQITRLGLNTVRLMGHTRDIERRYLEASILAHPAAYEGFPLAVTEALAAGLPVVGFEDCSGLNSLVSHDTHGCLVSATGDRTANFAAALRDLMASAEKRAALSRCAPDAVAPYRPDRIHALWDMALRGSRTPAEWPFNFR
jgi:glycosyltransferase involved in cell wall biosynthesis